MVSNFESIFFGPSVRLLLFPQGDWDRHGRGLRKEVDELVSGPGAGGAVHADGRALGDGAGVRGAAVAGVEPVSRVGALEAVDADVAAVGGRRDGAAVAAPVVHRVVVVVVEALPAAVDGNVAAAPGRRVLLAAVADVKVVAAAAAARAALPAVEVGELARGRRVRLAAVAEREVGRGGGAATLPAVDQGQVALGGHRAGPAAVAVVKVRVLLLAAPAVDVLVVARRRRVGDCIVDNTRMKQPS